MTNKHQQFFGHLIWTADSLEKALMPEKTEGRGKRGQQRTRWLVGWHHRLADWTTASINRQEVAVDYSLSTQSPFLLPHSPGFLLKPTSSGHADFIPSSEEIMWPDHTNQCPVTVTGLEGARDPNRMNLRASNGHGDWAVTSFLLDFSGVPEALGRPLGLGLVRSLSEIKPTLENWAKKRWKRA